MPSGSTSVVPSYSGQSTLTPSYSGASTLVAVEGIRNPGRFATVSDRAALTDSTSVVSTSPAVYTATITDLAATTDTHGSGIVRSDAMGLSDVATFVVTNPTTETVGASFTKVPIGAGGWVTGNVISPDGLTRLARTDTLGAYYWDTTANKWLDSVTSASMPALYNTPDSGQGVQALAAANSVAWMGYRDGIFKSVDKAHTWTLSLQGPTTAPNTGNPRWYGNRMAVDPNNSAVMIYGTVSQGLYFTTTGGSSWTNVPAATLPFGLAAWGINTVAIDPSGNWYASPLGNGLWQSTDSGTTWNKISSDANFIVCRFLRAAANGDLMMTTHTDSAQTSQAQIFRLRGGTFTNVKPSVNQTWHDVAYDPTTPGRVFALAAGGYQALSTDGGATWAQPLKTMDSTDIPWLANANGFGNLLTFVVAGEINFDPVVSGRLWFSQGIGVWYADLTSTPSDPIAWHAQSRGIEQMVVNDVICPPGGPPIIVNWDRAIFVVGETQSAPVVSIAPVTATPIGTPATLAATLTAGYPAPFTYAWTVISAPGGSTATVTSPTSLGTTFTPDVAGSYTLQLVSSNSAGTQTKTVSMTAIGGITGLILPGTTGNYVATPANSSLDITGSFTLQAKLSMAHWAPSAKSAIVGKYAGSSKSYALNVDSTGLLAQIASAANGSAGSFNVSSGVLGFPDGSVQWVQLFYDATAQHVIFSKSSDGTAWTPFKTVSTAAGMGANPVAVSTAVLSVGFTGNLSTYTAGTVYQAKVFNSSGTLVAYFNAEAVTRTGTQLPASYTDTTGKVWTPLGTGWDWSS